MNFTCHISLIPAFHSSGQLNPCAFSDENESKRRDSPLSNIYLCHFHSVIVAFLLPITFIADYNFCIMGTNQKARFSGSFDYSNQQLSVQGGLTFQCHVLNMEPDVFALVTYTPEDSSYKMAIFSEESVPLFGPSLPCPPVFKDSQEFREFLIVKCKLQCHISV